MQTKEERKAYYAQWYAAHRETQIKKNRQWYQENKGKVSETSKAKRRDPVMGEARRSYERQYCAGRREIDRAHSKEWRRKNPEKVKHNNLRHSFGISLVDYNRLCDEAGFQCQICRRPEGVGTKKSWRLAVDHDHKSGKVRGLLCGECNTGLGKFKDSLGLLRAAAQYLLDRG